ncbi:uncharacterized protein LOC105438946 [Strongylocentrotus purpuratus]|uniref:Uncharacterized protein n=1 Tax=Strongylocentrotus purpuratus TaxID=7668 RepID=A0A7M7P433_STRPU|nr:uncharacterized protein LOC105438946 [Strongylocentrotus purpuratus]
MINTQQALPMIGVTLVEDFVKNPPPYFQVQHCVRHPVIRPVPERVNLCAHDKSHEAWFPDSMGRILKVSTVAQYDQLVQRLLTRPLVFDVKLERRHKSGRTRYILKCDIIVTVNTSHPVIQTQMMQIFDGGREDIVNGRNFALEFNFNSILKGWFRTVHQGQDSLLFNTTYHCAYANIVVTNSTEFNSMYSFSPEGVCMFLMCLPCCIFMCPIYRISRCLTTVDRDTDIDGEVSYLTFKREQRTRQDELLDMFRQYLVQQMMQQGSRGSRDQAYLGVPEVTRQPSVRGGAPVPRGAPPPPQGRGYPQHPAEMFQPYAPHPMNENGHVEHPVSPYGYGPTPPPPGAPMHPNPMGPTPPPPPPGVQRAPPTMAQPQAPPSYSQPLGAPATAQPELPSYDYVMGQSTDQDQLIT